MKKQLFLFFLIWFMLQYEWNRNQRFLFQAAIAFAMSHHLDLEFK